MPTDILDQKQTSERPSATSPRTGPELILATKEFARDSSFKSWWHVLSTAVVDFAVVRDLPRPAASRHFAEVARGGVVDAVVRNLCAEREQHLAEFA